MATNEQQNKENFNPNDMDALTGKLKGFMEQLSGTAENAKKAIEMMPSLHTLEKKKGMIDGRAITASLLDRGGVLIEFDGNESAAQYFNTLFPTT